MIEAITLTGNGDTVTFDGTDGLWKLDGTSGLASPPVRLTSDTVYGVAGARVRQVTYDPRVVTIPFVAITATAAATRDLLRRVAKIGWVGAPVTITTRFQSEPARTIAGYVTGSMEPKSTTPDRTAEVASVEVTCPDPYFNDTTPHTRTWHLDAPDPQSFFVYGPGWFLEPPAGGVFVEDGSPAEVDVVNDGDVDVWPTWTFTGPFAAGITVYNPDTFEIWSTGQVVPAGETLTVVADPIQPLLTGPDGSHAPDLINAGSTVFPLRVGTNRIGFSLPGGSVDSAVEVAWVRRWLRC